MKKIDAGMLTLALLASACGPKDADQAGQAAVNSASPAPAPTTPAAATLVAVAAGFSIDTLPVSNAPLGKFPFFGLPTGYTAQNKPESADFGHFLFWTGKQFENVEGQTYMVTIVGQEGKKFSSYELKRNMEALFRQAGAIKVADARIPKTALDELPGETRRELLVGLGDVWNDPAETWLIRRPNDAIWIHYTTNSAQGSLAVVQTKAFVATAALLPADQLKAALDSDGKAVIHVNFAIDRSEILPSSSAQIDAVIALLKADPALKLAINGYTDDSGSDAHNLALSDQRARAVHAALIAAGIAPARLQARGYGRLNPVSANTGDAGKAANRRVELIKL